MPLPPVVSPVTGDAIPDHYIHSNSATFRDIHGRHLLLRGINLSSSAKTPVDQPGAKLDGFWETAKNGEMSFVGRVLDLENGVADEHLSRLKGWGFNCLRYVVTWESIEHTAPGVYDYDYIRYTVALLRKCKEYGFLVYIDPHQDLFSRFAGGSGAPYWTILACGMNPEHFTATNAACIQCEWSPSPSEYPAMIWASNYSRLACQTLFTLWFAGRDYAPKCIIDGVNIQDYLESHYFNAMKCLGDAINAAGDLCDECVIGWDSLNEPNHGFLGTANILNHSKDSILRIGPMPTAFEGMRLGMGQNVEVERWKFSAIGPKRDGKILIEPNGVKAWLEKEDDTTYGWKRSEEWRLGECIWALHGVWDTTTNEVLLPEYFDSYRGSGEERKLDFGADYWLPHWRRWAPVVRSFHPEAIHFIQTPVFQIPPLIEGPELMNRVAHSSHFYDGLTLVTKHWNWFNADALGILRGKYASVLLGLKIGETAIRACMRSQLSVLRQDTFDALGQFPTMMGEIGIPFDLDGKKAYTTGDYSAQTKALDASLSACDGSNALSYSIWTYCPDNSHEEGDLWNGEDLSVWSMDDADRTSRFRSTSQLNLLASAAKNRSRANSKANSIFSNRSRANSIASTPLGSRRSTPNTSTTRLAPLAVSYSTTTLVPPRLPYGQSPLPASASTASLLTNDPLAPINLNDGTRAIAAFVRPFPEKSVGEVMNIEFDIRSSKFEVTISVAWDAVVSTSSSLSSSASAEGEERDKVEIGTEIFLPLVHYAKFPERISRVIRNSMKDVGDPSTTPLQEEQDEEGKGKESRAFSRSITSVSALSTTSTTSTFAPPPSSPCSSDELAVVVEISEGRYEIEGQRLKWFYDLPKEGEADKVVKISVRRDGGAVKGWKDELDRSSLSPLRLTLLATKELCCPPDMSCVVS